MIRLISRTPGPRALMATLALAGGFAVTGCAVTTASVPPETSAAWQARVVAIAEDAAAGDPAAALEDLATLEAETTQARTSGEITAERAATIQEAIALVRTDLENASAAPGLPQPQDTAAVVVDPAPVEDSVRETEVGTGGTSETPDDAGNDGDGNDVKDETGNDGDENDVKGENGNDGKNETGNDGKNETRNDGKNENKDRGKDD